MIYLKLKVLYYMLDALMRNNQFLLVVLLEGCKNMTRGTRAFNITLTNS